MKPTTRLLLACASGLGIFSHLAGASTLLNEQFATNGAINTATTQNLPTSARWYTANATSGANVTSNTMVLSSIPTSGTMGLLAYFTASGSPQTLGSNGDYIQLQFQYKFAATSQLANAFRIGLLNSGGTRISTDNTSFNNAAFVNSTGYMTAYNFGGTGSNRYINYERASGANNIYSNNTGVGTGAVPNAGTAVDTLYSAQLRITKTATGVDIYSKFGDFSGTYQEMTVSDSTSAYTSFDTVIIPLQNSTAGTFSIDNVVVTAVPEPATWVLLAGGLVALVAFRRRRVA